MIINPDKSFGSSDPMCILQLSSLLVEHTAPNIHDSNKYCLPWGLTATTKPTRAVQVWQIRVHEDWTTYYTVTDRNEFNDTKSYELGGDGSNGCILPTGIMIRCFFTLSSSCHPLYV
ncbi:hypothetical protein EMCRGX_G017329 [Ephydatia muelleri]